MKISFNTSNPSDDKVYCYGGCRYYRPFTKAWHEYIGKIKESDKCSVCPVFIDMPSDIYPDQDVLKFKAGYGLVLKREELI